MRLQDIIRGLFITVIAAAALTGWIAESAAAASGASVPSPAGDRTHREAEAFLRAAEALYNAALTGNIFETRLSLRQTETRLRSLPMDKIATAEGIEALAESVTRMKRAVAAVSANPQKWVDGAAEIRLAADALAHREAPLWRQYRNVLREDVTFLAVSVEKSGASTESRARFEKVKGHYQLIRTSVMLHSEPSVTERADSIIRYAERLLSNANTDPAMLREMALPLKEAMDSLFPGRGNDRPAVVPPVAAPPWGWSAFMGTFIVSVLTWVGWRRYRAIDRVIPRESLPPERHVRR
ncbi:sporulation protein YpjB [Cohnella pontilimi]|nr:sporulation protein YpjB [Cohnella pontilimi]